MRALSDIVRKVSLRCIVDSAKNNGLIADLLLEISLIKNFARSLASCQKFWDVFLPKMSPENAFAVMLSLFLHCRKQEVVKILKMGVLKRLANILNENDGVVLFMILFTKIRGNLKMQKFMWKKMQECDHYELVRASWFKLWQEKVDDFKKDVMVQMQEVWRKQNLLFELDEKACMMCSKVGKVLLCSRCESVWFCSKTCQKAAWKAWHKQKCNPLED